MTAGCVVDGSVLVAALVDAGLEGRWSEQVIARGYLAAPELAVVEALNILRRLESAGKLTELEASSAQRDLQELEIDLMPVRPFEERIWELRPNVTCYDAWYVAVAEALGLPLTTLDHRLVRAHGPRCQILTPG